MNSKHWIYLLILMAICCFGLCCKGKRNTSISVETVQKRGSIDEAKKKKLIGELSTNKRHQIVPVGQFFDGNNDLGSIGCNLLDHPGIDRFREILVGLSKQNNIEAIYVDISEIDPGKGSWPFTDLVIVAGMISSEDLRQTLSPLKPDEVGPAENFGVPLQFINKHKGPMLAAWWD